MCLPSIKASEYVRELDGEGTSGCSTVPGRGNDACFFVMSLAAVSLWRRSGALASHAAQPRWT